MRAGEVEAEAVAVGGELCSVQTELAGDASAGKPHDSSGSVAGDMEVVVEEGGAADMYAVGVERWAEFVDHTGFAELEVATDSRVDQADGCVFAVAAGLAVVDPRVAVDVSVVGIDSRTSGVGDVRLSESETAADVCGEQPDGALR